MIPLLGRVVVALARLLVLLGRRWTLLGPLVALLLLAGSSWCRLQTVDHHSTGNGPKDQCACDQDRPDQAKPVEEASYHVITNYQRRSPTERSLESSAVQALVANWST